MSVPDPAAVDWVPLWQTGALPPSTPCAKVNATVLTGLAANWQQMTIVGYGWATEYDTDGIWNTSSGGQMVIKTAGRYRVTLFVSFVPNATGIRAIQVNKNTAAPNTASVCEASLAVTSASVASDLYASADVTLAAGDVLIPLCYQNTAGVLALSGNPQTFFAVQKIDSGSQGPAGVGGITLQGLYAARPAATAVAAGTTYYATDCMGTFRSDGTAWTLVAQGTPLVAASALDSAPWSTPYHGMRVQIQIQEGTNWTFQYNVNSTSAYKWEFNGGSPQSAAQSASAAVTAGGWNPGGPQITPPRSGEYIGHASAMFTVTGAMLLGLGLWPPSGLVSDSTFHTNAVVQYNALECNWRPMGAVTGGQTINTAYYAGAAGANVQARRLSILPIRIS